MGQTARADGGERPADEPASAGGVRAGPRRADWLASRERIINAATTLFARAGYRRTSTSELALAAGVSEPTLFRHFATKAALFEEAVVVRLRESVTELTQRRARSVRGLPAQQAALEFYSEMVPFLRTNAGLLVAALATLNFDAQTSEFTGLRTAFSTLLDYMDDILRSAARERGFALQPELTARGMLAMTLGFALCDPLLFDDATLPPDAQLAMHLSRFTAFGLPGEPT